MNIVCVYLACTFCKGLCFLCHGRKASHHVSDPNEAGLPSTKRF